MDKRVNCLLMRKILHTFHRAFRDAGSNIFHTLLSVLGMVIGVAALVGILSLIDGMEKFAHEQIASTTSLESIMINPKTTERVDNVVLTKDDYAYLDYEKFQDLQKVVDNKGVGFLRYRESGYLDVSEFSNVSDSTSKQGTLFSGILDTWDERLTLIEGRFISSEDLTSKDSVMVLNKAIAEKISNGDSLKLVLGKMVTYKETSFRVIGVIETQGSSPEVFVPITAIADGSLKKRPPMGMFMGNDISQVPKIKEEINVWIEENYSGREGDFSVTTNEFRVEQANQAFLIFRIVMGLIVGISVLVGGVGVMNVLLISVTERTAEIGVRKAVGAKRRDIIVQFLSESLTISLLGSFLGLVLGVLFTMIAVPIVRHFSEIQFEAVYTLNTLVTISVVAMIIGIVFGTYPAVKASKLDPVEAIRRD